MNEYCPGLKSIATPNLVKVFVHQLYSPSGLSVASVATRQIQTLAFGYKIHDVILYVSKSAIGVKVAIRRIEMLWVLLLWWQITIIHQISHLFISNAHILAILAELLAH
jgi:hypothetical protein